MVSKEFQIWLIIPLWKYAKMKRSICFVFGILHSVCQNPCDFAKNSHFGRFSYNLAILGDFWAIWPFWTILEQFGDFGAICPFWATLSILQQFIHFGPFLEILEQIGHVGRFWSNFSHFGRFGAIWLFCAIFGDFGAIWAFFGFLDQFGYFGPFLEILE